MISIRTTGNFKFMWAFFCIFIPALTVVDGFLNLNLGWFPFSRHNNHAALMSTVAKDAQINSPLGGAATLLKCDKLSKAYTGVPQFDEISFGLGKGQRVGLIGVNGAGKV